MTKTLILVFKDRRGITCTCFHWPLADFSPVSLPQKQMPIQELLSKAGWDSFIVQFHQNLTGLSLSSQFVQVVLFFFFFSGCLSIQLSFFLSKREQEIDGKPVAENPFTIFPSKTDTLVSRNSFSKGCRISPSLSHGSVDSFMLTNVNQNAHTF